MLRALSLVAAFSCAVAYAPATGRRSVAPRRAPRPVLLVEEAVSVASAADIEAKLARLQSPMQIQQQLNSLESQLNELVELKKQEIAVVERELNQVTQMKQELSQTAPLPSFVAPAADQATAAQEQVAAAVQSAPVAVQEQVAAAVQSAPTVVQEPFAQESFASQLQPAAEAAAAMSAASDAASIPWADLIPWVAAVVFVIFPTSVIVISEGSKDASRVDAPKPNAVASSAAAQARVLDTLTGTALDGRSAPDIFFTGLNNLGKEPIGWFFGKPSALYSNLPRPRPPTAPPLQGFTGVVVPTGAATETPQEKAARERAEMASEGKWDA